MGHGQYPTEKRKCRDWKTHHVSRVAEMIGGLDWPLPLDKDLELLVESARYSK